MTELHHRSLRILLDLQACQTASSGPRGIGRYSHALFAAILEEARDREIFVHLADQLPNVVNLAGLSESRVIRSPALPAWESPRDFLGGERDSLDSLSFSAFIGSIGADIVHISHVFEDLGNRVTLPSFAQRAAGQVYSATLYDLIPLVFQAQYFQDEVFRKWYLARVEWLKKADLLLAISESSRRDAIELLGIQPWRIVTIHGGVSPRFRPPPNVRAVSSQLKKRFGLRNRFILYTGADDYRKNMTGAIEGYAAVPAQLRENCQLVIVCSIHDSRMRTYVDFERSVGLTSDDVVMTGVVWEDDLGALFG